MDRSSLPKDPIQWLEDALTATRAYARSLERIVQAIDTDIAAPDDAMGEFASDDAPSEGKTAGQSERLWQLRARVGLAYHYAGLAEGSLLPALAQPGQGARMPDSGFLGSLEEERYRLARDIHDGPAQVLANAVLELQYCERLLTRDPTALPAELAQLEASLRDGLVEVRRLIFDLRPPALVEMGLSTSLRRYAEEFRQRAHIAVTLSIPETEERLASTQEAAVFRIVQEALQNVRKHAGATHVWLRVRQRAADWVVEVSDDGNGFVVDYVTGGRPTLGLISMRERAQAIGARFEVSSAPGEGTTITVVVPRLTAKATFDNGEGS